MINCFTGSMERIRRFMAREICDIFKNGANFSIPASEDRTIPNYGPDEKFTVGNAEDVMLLIQHVGVLSCQRKTLC